ncbi:hypothetical protein F5888DRAFT_888921 [Russula emetica]|nr:hypothetical protein F5888DRAFT_888921 [Russula emetica]
MLFSSQAYSHYPEGSLQPQPLGQRHGSRSPYAGPVPFPEPQYRDGGSASHPQAHFPPPQTTQNLTVATHHQHERRGSHGHSPATGWSGSSSDGQRLYPAGAGSDTGGGGNFYSQQPGVQPHHGGGYTTTAAQPQDWNAAVYNEGHDYRSKAPPYRPAGGSNPLCRYPRCTRIAFFDRRVNERREWCSDEHMQYVVPIYHHNLVLSYLPLGLQ